MRSRAEAGEPAVAARQPPPLAAAEVAEVAAVALPWVEAVAAVQRLRLAAVAAERGLWLRAAV